MRRGYRRVIGDFSRFGADMNEPDDRSDRPRELLEALRGYFARRRSSPTGTRSTACRTRRWW